MPDGGITLTKSIYDLGIQKSDVFRVVEYASNDPLTNPDYCSAVFGGSPIEGDSMTIQFRRESPPEEYQVITYTYTVTAGQSLVQVADSMVDLLNSQSPPPFYGGSLNASTFPAGSGQIGIQFNSWTWEGGPGLPDEPNWYWLDFVSVSSQAADVGSVQRILKKASSYQLALSYKDKYGRYFPLYTNESLVVETDPDNVNLHIDEAEEIQWSLNFNPPPGATSYQWLLSRNRTHSRWVQAPAKLDKANSGGNTWTWDITSLLDFIEDNNGTIVSYDYAQGDMARMVYKIDNEQFIAESYFTAESHKTLLIRSFEIEQDTEGNNIKYILKTTAPSNISLGDIPDNANVLLELYSPSVSAQDQIFYEIGPSYDINSNGEHSVTSGTIREGDSFIKFRSYEWVGSDAQTLWTLESQHISDYKISDFHNYGRPRLLNDVPEGVVSKVAGRYSDIYRKRNNTNMLNRFYAERLYESLSEEYGAVKHARMRDDILVIIQERKVAYVPVNRSIIEDLEAQQQISISDVLLNPHSYSKSDNIGIGTRIMSLSSNRSQFYFVDPYKKLPVRAGLDGVRYIGGKFSTEMMNLIDNQKEIVGYYDSLNDEYIVRIGDITYAYSEIHDKWISRYSYLPEIGITATDKMFTVKLGNIYVHRKDSPKNTFYGTVTKPTINTVVNEQPLILKTWQNLRIQADSLVTTTEDGIQTSLGQLSDLLVEDFEMYIIGTESIYDREGDYYANFLRAKPDINNGDRLKGNYVTIELTPIEDDFKLFTLHIGYQPSLATP